VSTTLPSAVSTSPETTTQQQQQQQPPKPKPKPAVACKPKLRPSDAVNKDGDNGALSSDSQRTMKQSNAESLPSLSSGRLPPAVPSRTTHTQPCDSRQDQTTCGEVSESSTVKRQAPALPSRTPRPQLNHVGNGISDTPSKRPAAALPSEAKVNVEPARNVATLANSTSAAPANSTSAAPVPISNNRSVLAVPASNVVSPPPVPVSTLPVSATNITSVPPLPPARPRHQQMHSAAVTGAFCRYVHHVHCDFDNCRP